MVEKDTWKLITATALFTVAVTTITDYAWTSWQAQKQVIAQQKNKNEGGRTKSDTDKYHQYDEQFIRQSLKNNVEFLGEDTIEKLSNQYVVVVGAGGVGSWVVNSLVRSGCRKIRVVDFDQVSLSSLNRHSCAILNDVGTPKVECLRRHMREIAPWCEIDPINELWTLQNGERLTLGNGTPDFIVDCIDNIDTKVDLLEFAYNHGIKVISSMGASAKSDPTKLNVGDLATTEEDPLARVVRRKLKKRGILSGIPVVFSAEKPDPKKAKLLPLPDEEYERGKVDELSALKDFRVRILPVLGTMPSLFGLTITTWILSNISDKSLEPVEGKNRIKVYDGIYQSLAGQMSRVGIPSQRIPLALKDVSYLVEEVFKGKSPISGISTRLTLTKWDPSKPISLQNVVVLTKNEQKVHEDRVLKGKESLQDVYDAKVLKLVSQRFREEAYYSQFR
ncbi:APG_G0033450.mRNA.1.CDS.1 [Saccharomyces cerevisiae]|uniref:YKL027W-like protein n=1 Tax=Saccharomyces cerevisiae (strain JAY291) TaxID=574961 RepID=C7GRI7_YEAS2|nr:YKL027W-like protein [Saccharomyces cerevisiae JAY291]CAE6504472.1 Tcd2p [Saccharomyces cerevisiae PE-2]CAI4583172.1 CNB_1a_G0033130.mRNA.1.CDS.1 [Saccharomyces cerevisiae]CAF1589203.1 Tcd2p [Saccharomyces cerevisiae PE-2]CAI4614010.1 AEH_G0033400.mRNA.1.CDS.1 [Saccharomyces cerevisiae]